MVDCLPLQELHILVKLVLILENVETEVFLNHLFDGFNIDLSHVLLKKLKLHALISSSDHQAKQNVRSQEESWEISSM